MTSVHEMPFYQRLAVRRLLRDEAYGLLGDSRKEHSTEEFDQRADRILEEIAQLIGDGRSR